MTIGLDYGTSATKVVLREGDNPATVFALDGGCSGFEWFATPSSVRVDANRMWFGSASRAEDPGILYENLKVAMLTGRKQGPGNTLTTSEVEFLVAAHLAWCLAVIRKHLDSRHGPTGYRSLLHVAAPMEQSGSARLTRDYDRLLHAAQSVAFGEQPLDISLPMSRALLQARLGPLLDSGVLPDASERTFRVSPETLAPFVSLLQDRATPLGMHILVDVGAATTEVLVVRLLARSATGIRFVAYLDKTEWIGGNDFQPSGSPTDRQRLEKHIRSTLYEAFSKDRGAANLDSWRKITLLMSGGGVLCSDVRDVLAKEDWLKLAMQQFDTRVLHRMHAPSEVDLLVAQGDSGPAGRTRRNFHMLANAHGLSVPWQKWDGWFAPHEVEPIEKERMLQKPLVDWEDG